MLSFGRALQSAEINGISISEILMPPGLELSAHAHDAGQICFVLEGTYRERVLEEERLLAPGMMHVRPPAVPHTNRFPGESETLTFLVSIHPARWIPTTLAQPARMLGETAEEMRREMRRGDDAARAALEGLALLTLSRVARMPEREPAWLSDAASMIERRFGEPIALSSIAAAVGVRSGALSLAFRRHRGTSVGEAIRTARISQAKRLLLRGVPVAEVAAACGFYDQPHFTRAFRAALGTTPAAWAASAQRSKSSK